MGDSTVSPAEQGQWKEPIKKLTLLINLRVDDTMPTQMSLEVFGQPNPYIG